MRKVYVDVSAEFTKDGMVIPLSFEWEDGRTFEIDRLIDMQRAASLKVGGIGIRYTIYVCGKLTHIWFDDNEMKWFLEGI